MKCLLRVCAGVILLSTVKLPVLAETAAVTNDQAYLQSLLADVTSTWYKQRIRENGQEYVSVGEAACEDMREKGYDAVVKQQYKNARKIAGRNQPMGPGSYRGTLQLEVGLSVLKNAREYLCPDVPLQK
uniref:DUF732 domain-containing protein n=1 Tax=Cyanothece sp. (strain PCC 7425 / ATCC 29141) TaxID=395961 RepID=B8HNV7_CYAP4